MTLDELAELVAASTAEKSPSVLTAKEVEKTRAELQRIHLPKLTEVGIVDYDRDEDAVRLADPSGVEHCLRAVADLDLR